MLFIKNWAALVFSFLVFQLSNGLDIQPSNFSPGTNPCKINNGGCAEICLYNGHKPTCACSYGRIDTNDGQSCIEHEAFILYSRVSSLESIHIANESDKNPPIATIESKKHMKNSVGLAYDYDSKLIFYSDLQKDTINQVGFDGENQKVLVNQSGSVEGLVYEHRRKNLYWTSSSDNTINRIHPNGEKVIYVFTSIFLIKD